jgi:ATP diphosphatase
MSESCDQYQLSDLSYIMSRLRDPDGGCPWDLAQDFTTIASSTIEEAYELVDAIFANDKAQIKEELGDVLFQVVFYSQLGKEESAFSLEDVIDYLCQKLIRRHPHVFPNGDIHQRFDGAIDVEQVKQEWERIKAEERGEKAQTALLDDIPKALPALKRAQKMQKRASAVGFDWPDALSAISKVEEELAELKQAISEGNSRDIELEMGDLLFSCVNVARHLQLNAEKAVMLANRKFEQRFAFIEQTLIKQGKTLEQSSLVELDTLWEQAKQEVLPA